MEWGMKAGIFLDGVQVGALSNWTLKEKFHVFPGEDGSPKPKGMIIRKIVGWKVSAVRYLIRRPNLTGKELGFKFRQKDKDLICKGRITTEYKTGVKAESLEIEGDTAPRLNWRI
jgi:hypothetical protein